MFIRRTLYFLIFNGLMVLLTGCPEPETKSDQVTTPFFIPEPGTYRGTLRITIASATTGASILYTTDGSTPEHDGSGSPAGTARSYGDGVEVLSYMEIKAVGVLESWDDSEVASAEYSVIPKRFVAVGEGGEVHYSDDNGRNWTPAAFVPPVGILHSVETDRNGNWVAVGSGGTVIYSTDRGDNWTIGSDSAVANIYDVAHDNNGIWFLFDNPGPEAHPHRSNDGGQNWVDLGDQGTGDEHTCIAFGVGRWIGGNAVGDMFFSDDGGTDWSNPGEWGDSNRINDAVYNGSGRWVLVGFGSDFNTGYSTDGINWIQRASAPDTPILFGVTADRTRFVVVGEGGAAFYSTDGGENWEAGFSGTGETLNDVATDGSGIWVAVGTNGTIVYSTNGGENWNAGISGIPANLNGIACEQ